jgi:arylsulfatase A-like enzyme
MHGSHGRVRKTNPFQEAIHIPFIISGEQPWYDGRRSFDTDILTNHEVIASGSTIKPPSLKDIIINHVDIAPTTLGLCGIKKPDYMDGNDYSDVRRAGVSGYEVPDCAYLQSVIPIGQPETIDKPWRGIVTNDGWKYVCFEGIEWLMFNLNEDPYEQMNLAHDLKYKVKRKELNDKLKKFIEKTNDKFELPNY